MDDSNLMAVLNNVSNYLDNLLDLFLAEALGFFGDVVKEFATKHQVHDEAPMSIVFVDVKQSDNVWMIKLL